MKGVCLRFYMYELQKHREMLLHEWLLEFAKKNKVHGGVVFRAIAGYGRHGIIHEEHFFELASEVPIEVSFFMKREEAVNLISLIAIEKVNLFYSISEADYGMINEA